MKLSALNVVFTSLNFAPPPAFKEFFCMWASNLGIPFKILTLGYSNGSSHARWWHHILAYLGVYFVLVLHYDLTEEITV